MARRLCLFLGGSSLLFLGWVLRPGGLRAAPRVRQGPPAWCGVGPIRLSWPSLEGASGYEIERGDYLGDRGLFCRTRSRLTGEGCRCSSSDVEDWPEPCWSNATSSQLSRPEWKGIAWSGPYRVRGRDGFGRPGPWSTGQVDCSFE